MPSGMVQSGGILRKWRNPSKWRNPRKWRNPSKWRSPISGGIRKWRNPVRKSHPERKSVPSVRIWHPSLWVRSPSLWIRPRRFGYGPIGLDSLYGLRRFGYGLVGLDTVPPAWIWIPPAIRRRNIPEETSTHPISFWPGCPGFWRSERRRRFGKVIYLRVLCNR